MIVPRSLRPLLLASALLAPCLLAQQKASTPASTGPTIAVDARLVNLPVVVRDKKGALIQNLTKDDFVLQVDGKPQTIRYFDKDTNLPLTLGLLVDTSLSQRDVIDEERTASSIFLDQMLTTSKDKAFIMQFAAETELLQDLTSSRPLLQAALKEIDTPSRSSGSSGDDTSGRRPRGGGGTVLYDALFLASDELMSKQTGRKAIIILSDGGDGGGNNGGNYPNGRSHTDGKKVLERMAQETGGRLFEVKKNLDVAQIYNQIAEELRAQYRLGYTPTQDAATSGYHRID